jgi:hypothetical protein
MYDHTVFHVQHQSRENSYDQLYTNTIGRARLMKLIIRKSDNVVRNKLSVLQPLDKNRQLIIS